jgi:hypothetical protein
VSLAIATRIPVSAWLAEDDTTIVTAFELLDEQAEAMEEARRGR